MSAFLAFGIFQTLYLLYAIRVLHFNTATLGVLISLGGVSSMAGAYFSARVTRTFGMGKTLVASALLSGVANLLVPLAAHDLHYRTGGLAFFPKTLDEVDEISKTVARDIRNQYTIGYKPTNPRGNGGFRSVRVEAKAKGHGKMTVRTKSGYYAGVQPAAPASK